MAEAITEAIRAGVFWKARRLLGLDLYEGLALEAHERSADLLAQAVTRLGAGGAGPSCCEDG